MIMLTKEQADALNAFLEGFDDTTTGGWREITAYMVRNYDIADPEAALEDARAVLRGDA